MWISSGVTEKGAAVTARCSFSIFHRTEPICPDWELLQPGKWVVRWSGIGSRGKFGKSTGGGKDEGPSARSTSWSIFVQSLPALRLLFSSRTSRRHCGGFRSSEEDKLDPSSRLAAGRLQALAFAAATPSLPLYSDLLRVCSPSPAPARIVARMLVGAHATTALPAPLPWGRRPSMIS